MQNLFAGAEFSVGRVVEVFRCACTPSNEGNRSLGTGRVIGWGVESRVLDEGMEKAVGHDTIMFVELQDGRIHHACPGFVRFLEPAKVTPAGRRVLVTLPPKFRSGEATFHGFGQHYEEFQTGPGNYPVAIVEWPDGEVSTPPADCVKFLDFAGA